VCILLYFLPWITRQVNANLDNVSFWFHLSKKKTLEVAIYLGPSVDEKGTSKLMACRIIFLL